MNKDFSEEIEKVDRDLKKYRLAAVSFLVLNVMYIIIAWWKMPPVDLEMSRVVYGVLIFILIVFLVLTPMIYRGKKFLVQVLTFVYGGRAVFSIYSLIGGDVFPAVPYLLPCVISIFYFLGRAAWDWP
ncbi:MAG: hypothetical protein HOL75_05600 [Nitrospina sp.]|nr:hypothetical protein [Nitrospina sp.]